MRPSKWLIKSIRSTKLSHGAFDLPQVNRKRFARHAVGTDTHTWALILFLCCGTTSISWASENLPNDIKSTTQIAAPKIVLANQIDIQSASCGLKPYTVTLKRSTGIEEITLPQTGKLFGEGHYVTTEDRFASGDRYPARMEPQPSGYPPPYQCNEEINAHLQKSLARFRNINPAITFDQLYPDKWAKWWTPEECGRCGQGSRGDAQLRQLTPDKEMWFMTMNWAPGHPRPAMDTRFLASANGRHAVVIGGYETGPGGDDKLGGVTREVHAWLQTDNDSATRLAYLIDQNLLPGPIDCGP